MRNGFLLLSAFIILTACTVGTTDGSLSAPNSATQINRSWVGTWGLISETISTAAGEEMNPAKNKILTITSDHVITEDYNKLKLQDCVASGEISSIWEQIGNHITVSYEELIIISEPKIECTVNSPVLEQLDSFPRSIIRFTFGKKRWSLTLNKDGSMLTATLVGDPGTITQLYERK